MNTPLLAYAPTPEFWALLTLIVGGVGKGVYDIISKVSARRDTAIRHAELMAEREQDRLDRQELATLTAQQLETIVTLGSAREQRLTRQVMETRKVALASARMAKEMMVTANNTNDKILSLGLELKEGVQKVELVNEAPIPTHETPIPHETQSDA